MFFLFLVSGIFGSVMIYRFASSNMSKPTMPFTLTMSQIIQNQLVVGFSICNSVRTNIELYCKNVYERNEFIHNIFDCLYFFVNKIHSVYYKYQLEPPEHDWINHSILYNLQSNNHLIEFYDTIAYNPNKNISKAIMSNKTTKFMKSTNNNNITSHKNLFIMKFNQKYIFKTSSEGMYHMHHLKFLPVSNPFFSVEYVNLDTEQMFDIDLPKNIFIEGNEILSNVFIKRLFAYKSMDNYMNFTMNYIIRITDDNFNKVIIKPSQYIVLNKGSYAITDE
tara:strand:+ start:3516 stop:4349 length:834 start_codon:yes stop_codon:yes gene_type:complete